LIDSFNVSEANILRFDNEKRSFEKILFGNERIVTYTTTGRVYNIS